MGFSIGTSAPRMGPRGALDRFADKTEGKVFDVNIMRYLLRYIIPYRLRLLTALLAMLTSSGLTLLTPFLIKEAIDNPITNGDLDGLNQIALLLIASFIGIYLAGLAQRYFLSWVGARVLADIRADLFRHMQELSLGYHDTHIIGVTISRVINDVAVINQLLSQGIINLIGDTLLLIGIVIVMLSLNVTLALLTFAIVPVMVVATMIFAKRAKIAFRQTRTSVAAMVGELAENLSGMRVIQAFAQEDISQGKFDQVNADNRDAHVSAMSLSFIFLPTVEFLGMLATGVVLWFGGRTVAEGDLTLGVVVAFLAYVTRFFQPIQELSQIYTTMQAAMAGGERVITLLETPSDVADAEDAHDLPPIEGRVELSDVHFAYQDDVEVLHDVNLSIPAGYTVALVGPTGAGKTSIANLVARFYDVTEGAILVDDVDIRTVTQGSLRRQMGLVPQDPFLFAGTIADNIRFGRPEATDDAVISASKSANAHDFIMATSDGYQTEILENGVNLSVGQRQLICIARAVLADPRILILDEATSSVDTVTEMLIQEALDRLLSQRTALVIAHRLSTIVNADMICVVRAGEIVEQGTHDELIAQGGLYSELYDKQFVKDNRAS